MYNAIYEWFASIANSSNSVNLISWTESQGINFVEISPTIWNNFLAHLGTTILLASLVVVVWKFLGWVFKLFAQLFRW